MLCSTRIWRETEDLGRAVVFSHGSLGAEQIFVGAAGTPAIGDFSAGTVGASPADLTSDRAQVLVTTSLAVGRERAISAAVKALGLETAAEILPYLQPAVLDRVTRRVLRDEDWSIDDLRDQLSTAIGVEPPELERLRRVTVRSVVTVVVVGLVAYDIISAVSNAGIDTLVEEFRKADLPVVGRGVAGGAVRGRGAVLLHDRSVHPAGEVRSRADAPVRDSVHPARRAELRGAHRARDPVLPARGPLAHVGDCLGGDRQCVGVHGPAGSDRRHQPVGARESGLPLEGVRKLLRLDLAAPRGGGPRGARRSGPRSSRRRGR